MFSRPSSVRRAALALSLAAGLFATVSRAEAQTPASPPACTAGTLASYAALGAAGCVNGNVTFGAFRVAAAPATSTLTPFTSVLADGRAFAGFTLAFLPPVVSDPTNGSGEGFAQIHFAATADSVARGLAGMRLDQLDVTLGRGAGATSMFIAQGLPGAVAQVQAGFACSFVFGCTTADARAFAAVPSAVFSVDGFTFDGIGAGAGPGQVNGVRFGVVSASVVPEPGTYALVAGGLAALAGVARRRRVGGRA